MNSWFINLNDTPWMLLIIIQLSLGWSRNNIKFLSLYTKFKRIESDFESILVPFRYCPLNKYGLYGYNYSDISHHDRTILPPGFLRNKYLRFSCATRYKLTFNFQYQNFFSWYNRVLIGLNYEIKKKTIGRSLNFSRKINYYKLLSSLLITRP